MYLTFILILSAALILLMILDSKKKLEFSVLPIYIAAPFAAALVLCINAFASLGTSSLLNAFSDTVDLWDAFTDEKINGELGSVLSVIGNLFAAVPVMILSLIGGIASLRRTYKTEESSMMGRVPQKLLFIMKHQRIFAVAAAIIGLAAIVFACIAASTITKIFVVGFAEMLLGGIIVTLLTFGIALILMIIILPFYCVTLSVHSVLACLPFAASAVVFAAAFCVIHILAFAAAVYSLKLLYSDGVISKKKAILMGLLSALPVVNIFIVPHLKKCCMN